MNSRTIIHVDMDAFFASVEQRDNKKFKNKPVIVGGSLENRGVVSTASYEARKYGVHSAMSIAMAKKLCPEAIFLPVNMKKYKEVSRSINDIFRRYSHTIEPVSIDEAFIDITGKEPLSTAMNIKRNIKDELDLTASVGISVNKLLAKIASDTNKPDGLTIIGEEEAVDFLRPLSLRKLWGIGPKTERELKKLGIYTIGDLQNYDVNVLIDKFGKRGEELFEFSMGIDNRPVEMNIASQSIGEEETFVKDTLDMEFMYTKLQEYSLNISYKLEHNGLLARTITVKLKYEDFSTETRSITLNIPTDEYETIYEISLFIFKNKFLINKKIRLLGITASNFIYPNDPLQLSFTIK